MNTKNLKCSVIIPAYNVEQYIEQSIISAINQEHINLEIIIINDGSTDKTFNIAKTISEKHSKIRVITQENQGEANARNAGIKHATGEYIAFLDSDDFWLEGKLNKQIQLLHATGADFVSCLSAVVNKNGKYIGRTLGMNENGSIFEKMLEIDRIGCGSAVVVKKEVFDKVGLFDETLTHRADWDMWLRLSKHYKISTVPEILVAYRRQENNASYNYDLMASFGEKVILKNINGTKLKNEKSINKYISRDLFNIGFMALIDNNPIDAVRLFNQSFKKDLFGSLFDLKRLKALISLGLEKILGRHYLKLLSMLNVKQNLSDNIM